MSGENWNEIMYFGIESCGYATVIYFLAVYISSAFIIMNLFIAILLRDYATGTQSEKKDMICYCRRPSRF